MAQSTVPPRQTSRLVQLVGRDRTSRRARQAAGPSSRAGHTASLWPRLGSLRPEAWYPLQPSRFVLASFRHRLGRDYASPRSRLGLASDSPRPRLESPRSRLGPASSSPRSSLGHASIRLCLASVPPRYRLVPTSPCHASARLDHTLPRPASVMPRNRLGLALEPPRLSLASNPHFLAKPRPRLSLAAASPWLRLGHASAPLRLVSPHLSKPRLHSAGPRPHLGLASASPGACLGLVSAPTCIASASPRFELT